VRCAPPTGWTRQYREALGGDVGESKGEQPACWMARLSELGLRRATVGLYGALEVALGGRSGDRLLRESRYW
jgi:hypothetical protein